MLSNEKAQILDRSRTAGWVLEPDAKHLLSLAGIPLVAAANDLILFFFAFELVSVPTYVLVGTLLVLPLALLPLAQCFLICAFLVADGSIFQQFVYHLLFQNHRFNALQLFLV